jgi:hypothetical protein
MTGAVMQLALVGAADVIMTGSPEISFFKSLTRRYTHYAAESVQMAFQGTADFGRSVSAPITRSGDLVSKCYLQITLPDLNNFHASVNIALAAPTSTVPAIISARFTSSTTALVTITPPTSSSGSHRYRATLSQNNEDGVDDFFSALSSTTILITALDKTKSYSVVVNRQLMSGTSVSSNDSNSASMDIICLKWCNSIGHAIMRSVECQLGGARIDRHVSEFFDIMSELNLPEEKRAGFEQMVGKYANYDLYDNSFSQRTLFVPLIFFFNKAPSLSIPLVALAFHELKLNFEFRDWTELIKSNVPISTLVDTRGSTPSMECKLYSEMYLLDTEERLRFSSMPQEMIIEVCQFLGDHPIIVDTEEPNLSRKISLNFSHPVKELIFVYNHSSSYNANVQAPNYAVEGNDYFNCDMPSPYTSEEPIITAKLQINGSDRIEERPSQYYRLVQPFQHHARIPNKKVYVYSLSLNADDIQPSGSLNWSRVDQAHLVLKLNPNMINTRGRVRVFAISYNLLRIASGLGGLAFAGG